MKQFKLRLTILIALYAAFAIAAFLVVQGKTVPFDDAVYAFAAARITPARTSALSFIADFGGTAAVVAICFVLLLLPFTRVHFGLPVSLNATVSALANEGIKRFIARPRPDILRLVAETNYSFPSGHAMNNAALYAMLVFLVFRCTWKQAYRLPALAAALFLPLAIGASRVYLGVHYASDVLAGWILGLAIALTLDTVFALHERRKTPHVRYYSDR